MKVKKAKKGFSPTKLTLSVAAALAAIGSAPAIVLAADSAPTAATAASAPTVATTDKLEEIMITARRDSERLQDVPVSVQVVSGAALQKMSINSVEEVSKLAPGLTLVNAGANAVVVLRGVTWQPGSGTPATPIYFNEVPFDPGHTIVSMYDMEQIEVLRGPQGTTRGAPSISGAVTMTTKRPDLRKFGGYAQTSVGQGGHNDFQGAVNFPIINRELAVRLATNMEESEYNRVKSVNSSVKPSVKEGNLRATMLWQPTDALSFEAMYSHRRTTTRFFDQVAGPGSPGSPGGFAPLTGLTPPQKANFNGPALSVADRAGVQDQPYNIPVVDDLLTINASWEVLGHLLSYNYGGQYNRSPTSVNSLDKLNIIPGFEPLQLTTNAGMPKWKSNELRLSSMPDPGQRFNYDLGWFQKKSSGILNVTQPNYLSGAFGNPINAVPGAITTPNQNYVLGSSSDISIGQEFTSLYGNIRFHISDPDEVSFGLAQVRDRNPVSLKVSTGGALNAYGIPLPSAALCPFVIPTSTASLNYPPPGVVCDIPIAVGSHNSFQPEISTSVSDLLYNFSLSHKFSDDLLSYFTTGTSFRSGLAAINNPGLPADLTQPKPEKATSYELGVKSSIGDKLRINAAVFQLDYKNQLTTFEGIPYFNTTAGNVAQTSIAFYRNIDAQVRGLELSIAANPIQHLTLGADFSYSKIKSMGGNTIPTSVGPTPTAANPINLTTSQKGTVLNTQSPFQATFNGGYEMPLDHSMGAYFRFSANYHGNNPNYGNFLVGNSYKSTPAYTLVDLFAGITGEKGSWELGLYAKNVFDKQVELARVKTLNAVYTNFAANPGYDVVRTNLPREAGVKLRYAFGSK